MVASLCHYAYSFSKIKPYVKDVIDNQYILDLILGVGIFVVVIFLILIINKGISKTVKYSGIIGKVDTVFGFFLVYKSLHCLCLYFCNYKYLL